MVFVYDEICWRAGVFVLRVLAQRPHIAAARPVHDWVGPWDHEAFCDAWAVQADFFCVAQNSHCLPSVHCRALHFRLLLKHRQFWMIRRIHRIAAHMVQALTGLFRRLVVSARPLVVRVRKSAGAGLTIDPAVGTAQIKHLPRFQDDRLSGIYAPGLDALSEPPDDPICPGRIKDIREVIRPLSLEVVQVSLTGEDLILTALLPQPSLHHLLCIHADRMVQPALPPSRQRDHRPGQCLRTPPLVSGRAGPGRTG